MQGKNRKQTLVRKKLKPVSAQFDLSSVGFIFWDTKRDTTLWGFFFNFYANYKKRKKILKRARVKVRRNLGFHIITY